VGHKQFGDINVSLV